MLVDKNTRTTCVQVAQIASAEKHKGHDERTNERYTDEIHPDGIKLVVFLSKISFFPRPLTNDFLFSHVSSWMCAHVLSCLFRSCTICLRGKGNRRTFSQYGRIHSCASDNLAAVFVDVRLGCLFCGESSFMNRELMRCAYQCEKRFEEVLASSEDA